MSWIASDLSDAPRAAPRDPFNPFRAGERLAGKYEVIEPLGGGGVGYVIAARHVGFDSQVALKFLHPEYASDPEVVARFVREARAGFRIDNRHVARVIDLEELEDGTPFIVMERLRGSDLRRVLDHTGKLASQRACQYGLQACAGLQAAHALGVIHRDIKPENLFLVSSDDEHEQGEHIKVLDFGISKLSPGALIRTSQKATTQIAIGTPQYMSPEQVRGAADLDARTDIWALGCVLYELLTGVAPFGRATIAQSCAAVLEDKPLAPNALCPELPPGLSALVLACLHKDRARRPVSAEALAAALAPFANNALQPSAASFETGPVVVPGTSLKPRVWVAAVCIVLGVLGGVWWAMPGREHGRDLDLGSGNSDSSMSMSMSMSMSTSTPTLSAPLMIAVPEASPNEAPSARASSSLPTRPEGTNASPTKPRRSKLQAPSAPEKRAEPPQTAGPRTPPPTNPRAPDPDVGF